MIRLTAGLKESGDMAFRRRRRMVRGRVKRRFSGGRVRRRGKRPVRRLRIGYRM